MKQNELSLRTAAKTLGMPYQKALKQAKAGELPVRKDESGKKVRYYIEQADVDALCAKAENTGEPVDVACEEGVQPPSSVAPTQTSTLAPNPQMRPEKSVTRRKGLIRAEKKRLKRCNRGELEAISSWICRRIYVMGRKDAQIA